LHCLFQFHFAAHLLLYMPQWLTPVVTMLVHADGPGLLYAMDRPDLEADEMPWQYNADSKAKPFSGMEK
jgi:hypothetical protein